MNADAPIRWVRKKYDELDRDELYALLRLRQIVFVVEQNCVYLDLDDKDRHAWHLLGWLDRDGSSMLAAYARVFPAGIVYPEASIGRVITHPEARRGGWGRALMAEAIRRLEAFSPGVPVRIGAQLYLQRFYESFGFVRQGEPYDEDGILHIEMVREGR